MPIMPVSCYNDLQVRMRCTVDEEGGRSGGAHEPRGHTKPVSVEMPGAEREGRDDVG